MEKTTNGQGSSGSPDADDLKPLVEGASQSNPPEGDGESLTDCLGGLCTPNGADPEDGRLVQEVPGYALTHQEVLVLAEHWKERASNVPQGGVPGGSPGGEQGQSPGYAAERLARIVALIGQEGVDHPTPWWDVLKQEVEGYPLTRQELLLLARHWLKRLQDNWVWRNFSGMDGSAELRADMYTVERLDRIAALVGKATVQALVPEVEEETRRNLGEELWRIFTSGTKEERERVWDEFYGIPDSVTAKREDRGTQEKAFAYLRENPCEGYRDEAGDLWTLSEPPWAWGSEQDAGLLILQVTMGEDRFPESTLDFPKYTLEKPAGWVPHVPPDNDLQPPQHD